MNVDISPELEVRLSRFAAEQGRDAESLVCEAVERLVGFEEWFVREVETGIASADRVEFIEHAAVRAMIEKRYPG